jgi:hypothetical protein
MIYLFLSAIKNYSFELFQSFFVITHACLNNLNLEIFKIVEPLKNI